jgi:hypothetical protein
VALAKYRDLYWFPSGTLAANVPARIFPMSSNTLALLFTDVTGAVALPNPLNTDGAGFLEFWAEEGEYWVYIDSRSFRISVGNPVQLDAWDGASVALSTGVMSGGNFTANGTSIDVQETVGYVVDYSTDDFRPSLTRVHVPAQSVALSPAALARTLTWWQVDSTGAFIELLDDPTAVQRRTAITLGFSIVFGGVVVFTKSVQLLMEQPANQYADLTDNLGPFIINGALHSPNGVNLSWNLTAGEMFSRSFNHMNVPNNPNVAPIAAQTPAQFRRATSTTTVFVAPVTTVDPANYDVGGVITPVPGGTNTSTIQRVFVFAQDNAPDQLVVQYGQRTYSNLTAAVAGIGVEPYVVNPVFVSALVGWICVTKAATNLSDPTQATFIPATAKFARP